MKKIVTLILLMCMFLTFVACADNGTKTPEGTTPETTAPENTAPENTEPEATEPENTEPENTEPENTEPKITMQEIYDANQTEALFKNHQSISIRDKSDGVVWVESYLTKEYIYKYFPGEDEASVWAELITDATDYYYMYGSYLHYVSITPDAISDFASTRADRYVEVIFGEDILKNTIESVTQKDGLITVKTLSPQEFLEEFDATSAEFEYVLNANTREIIAVNSAYVFNDGTVLTATTEISYDTEAPEFAKTFLQYANQTENLRTITVVNNPGTDKEVSKTFQAAKGLIIGLSYEEDSEYEFEVYTDAACTEAYDPYVNTDSDLTIYIKWNG